MKLIVGLGNPGPKYETTRHNVGFLAIDRLVDRWKASGPITKNLADVYQASFGGEKVLLLKPQTFMNLSGKSVGPTFQFNKCEPTDLIVIHDELDIAPGALRLKTGGGAGGHNGLKSIDETVGKDKTGYHRVRIGIGHPSKSLDPQVTRMSPADYVLAPFKDEELSQLDPLLDEVSKAIEMILEGKMLQAMNQFHRGAK